MVVDWDLGRRVEVRGTRLGEDEVVFKGTVNALLFAL